MNNNHRLVAFCKMLLASLVLVSVAAMLLKKDNKKDSAEGDNSYYLYDFAMGTSVSYQIYGDTKTSKKAAEDLNNKIKLLDENMISWRSEGSELFLVNNNYVINEEYQISDELSNILSDSLALCEKTGGALDITIRPLASLWGIEDKSSEEFSIPDASIIKDMIENIGYENISIRDNGITISKDNMVLDLGAIGKGYALDYVRNELISGGAFKSIATNNTLSVQNKELSEEYNELTGAIVSVGGSILVLGSKPNNKDWKVGIRNPKGDIDEMIGYIDIAPGSNVCISTSGDYEKYIEKDGKKYHHIIDPASGYPAESDLSSVTIVCENGLISDGLSTACFILGYEASQQLLKYYDAEAIFIDKNNNITVTGNLEFILNN